VAVRADHWCHRRLGILAGALGQAEKRAGVGLILRYRRGDRSLAASVEDPSSEVQMEWFALS
jgi:hypothetical protein